MAELLKITDHGVELPGQEAVRIRKGEQQRLQINPLGRHLGLVLRDRALMDAALARKRIDRMRIEPGFGRHRRIGQIAVDQHPGDALQAAVDERNQEAVAREQNPLLRFVQQQTLVGNGKLVAKSERRFRRLQRIAGEGVRCLRKLFFELWPQRGGGRPVSLRQLEALRVAHFDPVDRRQRIADDPGGLDGVAGQKTVEPGKHLGGTNFRRIGRPRINGRQADGKRHGGRGR